MNEKKWNYGIKMRCGGYFLFTSEKNAKRYVDDYNDEFGDTWRGSISYGQIEENPKLSSDENIDNEYVC